MKDQKITLAASELEAMLAAAWYESTLSIALAFGVPQEPGAPPHNAKELWEGSESRRALVELIKDKGTR
jgi:hypothetical protein